MAKSPDAFRTISEVSAWLETPPHVLRFWESKFTQVRPVKRAGGRRYYRPEDIALLGGIKVLLHEQGMTIRGVQKMLREQGVRHVASLSAQVWTEDGAGDVGLDGVPGDTGLDDMALDDMGLDDTSFDPDLDVALDVALDGLNEVLVGDDAEETEEPLDGVIVGPWAGREAEREADAAEEDEAHLAALDGLPAEAAFADGPAAEGAARNGATGGEPHEATDGGPDAAADEGSHGAPQPPTLIEAFVVGTLSRLAADGGAASASTPQAPAQAPERAPLPPGDPTLTRALELLRRADPDRLRARADRIAPLLQRLKALREGLPRSPS